MKSKKEPFYRGIVTLFKIFYHMAFRIKVTGKENIPREEGCIVCANHISNHDPFVLSVIFPEQMRFMSKKEVFDNPILKWICLNGGVFPIDRSINDIKSLKKSLSILKANENLMIFAEGTRNYGKDPLPVKAGIVRMAIKTNKKILPITIDSNYRFLSKINITIGSPVQFSKEEHGKLDNDEIEDIANDLMKDIYSKIEIRKVK